MKFSITEKACLCVGLANASYLENDIKIDYYFNDYYGDSDAWDFSMREGSFSIATAIEYFVDAKDSSKIFFKYELYDFGRTGHGISNYPNKYESSLTKNELQNENELRRSFLSHLDKISNPNYKISDNSFWIKLIKFIFHSINHRIK